MFLPFDNVPVVACVIEQDESGSFSFVSFFSVAEVLVCGVSFSYPCLCLVASVIEFLNVGIVVCGYKDSYTVYLERKFIDVDIPSYVRMNISQDSCVSKLP